MRTILTFLSLVFIVNVISSQITLDPECIYFEGEDVLDVEIEVFITNSGDEPTLAFWEFEPDEGFPDGWKFQVCDLNLCYFWGIARSSTSTSIQNVIEPNQTDTFKIKVANIISEELPISGVGSGTLKLYSDEGFENLYAESSCMVSTTNTELINVSIYPNPTTNRFQISNDQDVSKIMIYNIAGEQIWRSNHTQGMSHNMSSLRSGLFLVRLANDEGEEVKVIKMTKI